MSDPVSPGPLRNFVRELRLLLLTALQVRRMVPRRYLWALGTAAGVMVLTSLVATALPILLGGLVDQVQKGHASGARGDVMFRAVTFYLGCIAGVVLLREGLNLIRRFLVESTCTRIDKFMGVRTVSHLMQADLSRLTHEKLGALHGRIFRSVEGFMRLLRLAFLDFFPALLTGVFAIVAALTKQPWMGVVMIGVIPVSLMLTAWQLVSQKNVRLQLIRSREELDGTVVEQLGGIDYVRVANTHQHEVRKVAKAAEKRRAKEMSHHVAMMFFGSAKALTEGTFHVLVLGLAVYLAATERITYGDILTFSGLFLGVMTPLAEIHRVIDEGHEASLRVNDLSDILAEPVDTSFKTQTHRTPLFDDGAPVMSMTDVCVEYHLPGGRALRALDGVSLEIHRGETVGVAGRSGGGKSTWLKVLLRLVHPCAGQGRILGVPLEAVSREAISHLVGYVGQSPFLFAGTIEENIAYGAGPCLPEDIRRAAQRACIHNEIMRLPHAYQSVVAERGANLSGGQRQRLALARVFLKNPPILVLDEATAALDAISERQVQEAIAAARADRTVILVAHRLSTVADADRIVVFDEGRIAEVGTFHELVQRDGVLAELVRSSKLAPHEDAEVLAQGAVVGGAAEAGNQSWSRNAACDVGEPSSTRRGPASAGRGNGTITR
jgi:ATP-binding cassette subfamily B protein